MRSPSLLGFLSIALGLVTPSISSAQLSKDNTAPPIDVPTTPVPQGPTAPPPAPPPKAPPKPAPAVGPKPAPAAETPKDPPAEGGGAAPKFNNEGVFKVSGSKASGAVGTGNKKAAKEPAAAAKAPAGKIAKKTAANVAQWPGFRLTDDGGSEVLIEFSSNPTSPTEHRAAGSVTYVFKGAHVIKSNNQNPLLTVHFNTPVMSARLVPKKGELHLVVDMRPGVNAAPASGLRGSSDGDGQQFFVKFPSGAWLPKGAENEDSSPAPTQKLKNKPEPKKSEPPPTTAPKTESGGKTGPAP